MRKHSIEAIVRALNDAGVRYLIAGGLAVVAHGYARFTADVDVILDLRSSKLRAALAALAALGYRPRAPVALDDFADDGKRAQWVRDKGLTVFSLHSPQHVDTEVDLFVEPPLDFERAYSSALQLEVIPKLAATFVGFDDLVAMKQAAGRPQDLADLDKLYAIRKVQGS